MISLTRVVLHQVCEVACYFVVLVTCVKYSSNSCLRNSHAFVMLNLYLHVILLCCCILYCYSFGELDLEGRLFFQLWDAYFVIFCRFIGNIVFCKLLSSVPECISLNSQPNNALFFFNDIFFIQWKKVQIVLYPMHFSGPKHYYGLAVNPLDI
jgi:hypothetical protein